MAYTTAGPTPFCHVCLRPVIGAAVYGNSGEAYHFECTQPPIRAGWFTNPAYAPMPQGEPGCRPIKTLSEDDVRRIVREELKQRDAEKRDPNGT